MNCIVRVPDYEISLAADKILDEFRHRLRPVRVDGMGGVIDDHQETRRQDLPLVPADLRRDQDIFRTEQGEHRDLQVGEFGLKGSVPDGSNGPAHQVFLFGDDLG